jgi:hypothetical protein
MFKRINHKLLFILALTMALLLAISSIALAAVWTDQADYSPGSVVTISGDNSDGAGYLPGETVHVDVVGPNGYTAVCDAVADDEGAWSCQVTLDNDPAVAVGDYTYTATVFAEDGIKPLIVESGTFTDKQPIRKYSATISPTTDTAGHNLSGYTITINNDITSEQELGSANITAPVGYSAITLGTVSAPTGKTWTVSLVSGVIRLRSNADANRLDQGESVSVAFTTTSPCNADTYSWSTDASQETTSFTPPGNFDRIGTDPSVTVSGSCAPADSTPPVVMISGFSPDGNNGWFKTAPAIGTVSATDPSNVTTINCVDDADGLTLGELVGGGTTTASSTLSVTGEGTHNITCTATDGATPSNSGAASGSSNTATVKIDTVAPNISASMSPARPASGWWNIDSGAPTVSFTCSDDTSGLTAACLASHLFGEGADQSYSQTIYDNAGNSASAGVTDIDVDLTAPTVTVTPDRDPDHNGWYNHSVTFTIAGTDATSHIDSCDTAKTYSSPDGTDLTVSGSCTDNAGNTGTGTSDPFDFDDTNPTLSPSVSPNPVILNGVANASPNASDNLSGIATASCNPVNTSTVGPHSVSCSATDNAGNTASADASYSVQYDFDGFFAPVDNIPLVNAAKAGQAIPLKWRLIDANDQPISVLSMPIVTTSATLNSCGGATDQIESYAGSSGLQYLGDGYWQYNWKTPKNYSGMCMTMTLTLDDGTSHVAYFKFK